VYTLYNAVFSAVFSAIYMEVSDPT
jgi:hypothetical protein